MTNNDFEQLRKIFVSIERFSPVEKVVYGLTTLILTAAVIALMSLIIK
jgi:cell division protein FtsL